MKAEYLFVAAMAAMLFRAEPVAGGQVDPEQPPRVTLPFDIVDTLDGAKFQLRVPANWNGTLLLFVQGTKTGPPPAKPRIAPPALPGSAPLEETLLGRGYALGASEIAGSDWQVKAAVQDTAALATYFRARVGEPKRVIVWGMSLGGLTTAMLIENHPRSFDGGIAACAALDGLSRRQDRNLDYNLSYAVAFGWPDEAWGPVDDLKPGLEIAAHISPRVNWPKPDGSNRGGWEFIRLINGLDADAFWKTDPAMGMPGLFLQMYLTIWQRADAESWATGPVAQNLGRRYGLSAEEKNYLEELGVNAGELLARMNAQTDVAANPRARSYVERYGDVHGTLSKPLLTLHTTLDALADVRNQDAYRKKAYQSGCSEYLKQAYVAGLGHCAFTADQWLAALAALERWLEEGTKPGAIAFPEALGFDNRFEPPAWESGTNP